MSFSSDEEYHESLEQVPSFEQMLIQSGIHLLKYYLDMSCDERLDYFHNDVVGRLHAGAQDAAGRSISATACQTLC